MVEKVDLRTMNKKNKILDSAIRLFLSNDIKKVTMDEIALESNVSKMTIYKYFGDKESLYRHVSEKLLDDYYAELKRQFDSDILLAQKMINFTLVLTGFIDKGYASLCNELAALNDDVNNQLKDYKIKVKKIILRLITDGKKSKMIRDDISNECIYHYIDMGLNYFEHSLEYREKITSKPSFRKEFMTFIWSNVFIDYSEFNY